MGKPSFRGIVHHREGDVLWASRREVIFRSQDAGLSWQPVLSLPLPRLSLLKGQISLSRRLFRMMVNHLHWVENRYLVVMGFGRIFTYDFHQGRTLIANNLLQGKRPLVFCKTSNGRLLYGEYRGNPERSAVSVWGSADAGRTWAAQCTLEGVRHIHGVFEDPFEKDIWITTGDTDDESAIWKCQSDFSGLHKVIEGGQQARAITLQFTQEKVFYGSDTPLEENFLYSFDRKQLEPHQLAAVDGSVFHSCRIGDHMFFSTACEPSKVNRSGRASIYRVNADGQCDLLVSYAKDIWPMKLFQYGQIFLATGQEHTAELWLTPFATRNDQKSFSWDLNNEKGGAFETK